MKQLQSFETSGNTRPYTPCHISRGL